MELSKSDGTRPWELGGEMMPGNTWSEGLDGNELHGTAGGDLEPIRSAFFLYIANTEIRHQLHEHLRLWYYDFFIGVVL